MLGETDPLQGPVDARAVVGPADAGEAEADIVGDGEPRQQPGSWKTTPIRGWGSRTVSPSTATVPALARSSPAISRSNVVLPQPDPPISATISPGATDRPMPESACVPSA